eukprot:871505-Rhodomonas_salina.3
MKFHRVEFWAEFWGVVLLVVVLGVGVGVPGYPEYNTNVGTTEISCGNSYKLFDSTRSQYKSSPCCSHTNAMCPEEALLQLAPDL